MFHGASGALYGLSENGVPGADLIDPLHVRTIAQGPANAAQHPTGHADQVAPEFVASGGQYLLDYMQDYYSDWPYQDVGIPSYLTTVDTIVSAVASGPYASHYVFVPFNEPNDIWYDLNPADSDFSTQMAQFESDWATVYRRIRADDPGALIAGPNTSYYDPTVMGDFLAYAKANNVLPSIITWHELSPSSLQDYPANYASVIALEKQDGISPLPIDIDEYADRYHLSVPGEMVQWLVHVREHQGVRGHGVLGHRGQLLRHRGPERRAERAVVAAGLVRRADREHRLGHPAAARTRWTRCKGWPRWTPARNRPGSSWPTRPAAATRSRSPA